MQEDKPTNKKNFSQPEVNVNNQSFNLPSPKLGAYGSVPEVFFLARSSLGLLPRLSPDKRNI